MIQQAIIGALVLLLIMAIFSNRAKTKLNANKSKVEGDQLTQSTKTGDKATEEGKEAKVDLTPLLSEAEKEARLQKRTEELAKLIKPFSFPQEVVIYYGSQTGTAEKYAHVLDEEANLLKINSKAVDLDRYQPEEFLGHKLVILCISTHYEGDPTDNAKQFHKWLKNYVKKPEVAEGKQSIEMKYCIFGLGDTSYEQFNEMALFCDRSLKTLGATRILDVGAGNAEFFTTEDDFQKWKQPLWRALFDHFKSLDSLEQQMQDQLQQAHIIANQPAADQTAVDELPWKVQFGESQAKIDADQDYSMATKNFIKSANVKVHSVKQLRQQLTDGSTLEVVFDLSGSDITYKTAGNLAIYPENSEPIVNKFAELANLNLDEKFFLVANEKFTGKNRQSPLPAASFYTVRYLLTRFIDLTGPLTKKMLKDIAAQCRDKAEEKSLLELCALGNSKLFDEKITSKCVGLIDLLSLYPSVKLSLEFLIQRCNYIMPRYYTIASSALKSPQHLRIAISLSKFSAPDGQMRLGTTSLQIHGWQANPDSWARIFVKDSNFTLRTDVPSIMVGPGTGVVPFIAFIEERQMLKQKGKVLAEANMYFGCKDKYNDFIYREQLSNSLDEKIINQLGLAFSRSSDGSPKQYVQDLLTNQKNRLVQLLKEQNGVIYICGATKMGQEVQALLKEALSIDYFKLMQQEKRILVELWSS